MHSVIDVLSQIAQVAVPLPVESMPLHDARGRVLAVPISMDVDAPPFDRSLLDGYAVRAADVVAGAKLWIIARQDAGGGICTEQVSAGTCVAISTGAPVPVGADAILMVEHVAGGMDAEAGKAPEASAWIQSITTVTAGWGIQKRASDAACGQVVLSADTILGPAQLAVAAAAGAATVTVRCRPRVAVLTTGDEIVPVEAIPGPTQIRNSNASMLTALVERFALLSCGPEWSGDSPAQMRQIIERLLANSDVVLAAGSLSMGTRDFIPALATELGFTTHVQTVRIKPGKPFLLASRQGKESGSRQYLLGLPGNPVSALVCFHRFVRPLLARLSGALSPELFAAESTVALPSNGHREFCQPAILDRAVCPPVVTPLDWHGSADIFTLARANALIVHPESAMSRPSGVQVQVLEL